jgi:branched-subunit amino acid transport protein
MNIWLVILIAGIITYGIRLSFIFILGNKEIPERYQRILRLVPAAVLPALIFPDVFIRDDQFFLSITNFRMIAAIVAVIVAWRTKNVFLTIIAGMFVLLVLQAYI